MVLDQIMIQAQGTTLLMVYGEKIEAMIITMVDFIITFIVQPMVPV